MQNKCAKTTQKKEAKINSASFFLNIDDEVGAIDTFNVLR